MLTKHISFLILSSAAALYSHSVLAPVSLRPPFEYPVFFWLVNLNRPEQHYQQQQSSCAELIFMGQSNHQAYILQTCDVVWCHKVTFLLTWVITWVFIHLVYNADVKADLVPGCQPDSSASLAGRFFVWWQPILYGEIKVCREPIFEENPSNRLWISHMVVEKAEESLEAALWDFLSLCSKKKRTREHFSLKREPCFA